MNVKWLVLSHISNNCQSLSTILTLVLHLSLESDFIFVFGDNRKPRSHYRTDFFLPSPQNRSAKKKKKLKKRIINLKTACEKQFFK